MVRKDLLSQNIEKIPSLMNYRKVAEQNSMLNTPPAFALYLCGLVFDWLKEQGGVSAVAEINRQKADLLYNLLDSSNVYSSPVEKLSRSLMNIPFRLQDEGLKKVFLKEAETHGLKNLAGHRSVGGIRASIYNAVPLASVQALTQFMTEFEKRYG